MTKSNSIVALLTLLLGVGCGRGEPDRGQPADTATSGREAAGAGAEGEAAPIPGSPPSLDALCDTIDNSFRCARAIESAQLPSAEGVERRGDTLRLSLSEADPVWLVDAAGDGADALHFSYQRHWRRAGYYIVQKQYYEGSEYLLIDDATGARVAVPDRPLRGPDGERFAVLSMDLVAGYGPNVLQIWRLGESGPTLETETRPSAWGPVRGGWIDPETFRYDRACGPEAGAEARCGRTDTLRLTGGAWRLSGSDAR